MDVRCSVALRIMFLVLLSPVFPELSFSEPDQQHLLDPSNPQAPPAQGSAPTAVFPLRGNVYPRGAYTVDLRIGHPPRAYDLDIDSGSYLTWVQCDGPCKRCTRPPNQLYKPNKGSFVKSGDALCAAVKHGWPPRSDPPVNKDDQCEYKVEYEDNGTSTGWLVRDDVTLQLSNGTVLSLNVAFGCGYDQESTANAPLPDTAGVLGLGSSASSLLSQLRSSGLHIRNVVGHCLSGSANGGGIMFLGDKLNQLPNLVWTPILRSSSTSQKRYTSGPADLLFNGQPTSVKGLEYTFDSGATFTYLNSQSHKILVDLVNNNLKGKPLSTVKDPAMTDNCWKGQKPFKSLADVRNYFKPLALSFTKLKNTQLQIPPEGYLIVTRNGNVCLGILDSVAEKLGNVNIIGDISLQDKVVIYDNEKQQIGWVGRPGICDRKMSQLINQYS